MKVKRIANRGFTLVEILIVVVILGILAAVVVPQFTNAADDARGGNIATQVSTIQNQIELYRAKEGSYPTLAEMQADSADPDFAGQGWGVLVDGNYLKSPAANPYFSGNAAYAIAADNSAAWQYDEATGEIQAIVP